MSSCWAFYAKCHHAEHFYAECRHAEHFYAECRHAEYFNAELRYAECFYAECCCKPCLLGKGGNITTREHRFEKIVILFKSMPGSSSVGPTIFSIKNIQHNDIQHMLSTTFSIKNEYNNEYLQPTHFIWKNCSVSSTTKVKLKGEPLLPIGRMRDKKSKIKRSPVLSQPRQT